MTVIALRIKLKRDSDESTWLGHFRRLGDRHPRGTKVEVVEDGFPPQKDVHWSIIRGSCGFLEIVSGWT